MAAPQEFALEVIDVPVDNVPAPAPIPKIAEAEQQQLAPFLALFRFADRTDRIMVILAFICAILHGAAMFGHIYQLLLHV